MLESQARCWTAPPVWDLFAGSGAIGIEALSAGRRPRRFVDQARGAISATRSNLARLGYGADGPPWSAPTRSIGCTGSEGEPPASPPGQDPPDWLTGVGRPLCRPGTPPV